MAIASLRARKARMKKVVALLAEAYPEADCALHFRNPFEILIATILSAQCTDKKVNEVTPGLFQRYPTPKRLAAAKTTALEAIIHPLGFYKAKTKSLLGCAAKLEADFGGGVPRTIDELVTLPGVGRKTANCVLVNAFGLPGIMVDTHCKRVTARIGLHEEEDPDKIEAVLKSLFPAEQWSAFSHRIIIHGRECCHARKPNCLDCTLRRGCDMGKNL